MKCSKGKYSFNFVMYNEIRKEEEKTGNKMDERISLGRPKLSKDKQRRINGEHTELKKKLL